ncbi:MAG: aminotransferase class V-fold PLP-dependent enzyme [Clostridiales bacterium]|nr:aminotransferase class V-fold PLP-dependent enzyme [Clostridiales bacterium]
MKELPLYSAIKAYAGKDPARFHMPGHKGKLSPFDVTEVAGTDNLHSPHEAILESERLCAAAMGAEDAFFLVSGSTAGNLAMLMLLGCGKRVLLGRNCHKSVINGLAVAGHEAVPLIPDEDGIVTAEKVDEALSAAHCDAVFITSPTYRGAVSPIAEIAEAAHSHGALLFVDCAHGAHFAFSGKLPDIPAEADAWCVSCHKTLDAYTQTALLLTGASCPFSRERVQNTLNMFQSTSPSYPLMMSIEASVLAHADWDEHADRIMRVREKLASISGVRLIDAAAPYQDLTRLNIGVSGIRGRELEAKLIEAGIYAEMADSECVTLITTPSDKDEWYEKLISAIEALPRENDLHDNSGHSINKEIRPGERKVTVREAVTGDTEKVPIAESVGRICAGAAGCYPPGTAILFPGEIITRANADLLLSEAEDGAELFGAENGMATVLKEAGSV